MDRLTDQVLRSPIRFLNSTLQDFRQESAASLPDEWISIVSFGLGSMGSDYSTLANNLKKCTEMNTVEHLSFLF